MSTRSSIKSNYINNQSVELIRGGKPYFDRMLQMIGAATNTIHLQVYILSDDGTGRMVTDALKAAIQRQVKVYLLVDGYASQSLPATFVEELAQAGIQFRFFEPIFRSSNFYFGRRMHHKVFVVDAIAAMVGGMNVADRYNDTKEEPAWLDFALHVTGDTAKELCHFCRTQWTGYLKQRPAVPCVPPQLLQPVQNKTIPVKISRNDWVRRKSQVSALYMEMLRTSTRQVTILSAYFLPGPLIRRQIVKAVKRGVSVRVITAGKSDIVIAKDAERWLYDWLLRNGVSLCEYQKTVLHGKLAVCDDQWMTVGSYNINNISAYASLELNLSVKDAAFTKNARLLLEEIIDKDCIAVTADVHSRHKNPLVLLRRWLAYQFIRVGFFLFTFYFRQQN